MTTTTQQCLDAMLTRPENWNSHGTSKPSATSIAHAKEWIAQFQHECGESWLEPHVTADAWGDLIFEWWYEEKHLSLFVSVQSAEYLTSWRDCTINEMRDGDANTPEERATLWSWLMETTS
jgi:hypothetical protein